MANISYKKLWKLLIDKNLKKKDLQKMAGISSSSIAKLGRNENVNTEIINKICNALDCDTSDIMEMESEEAWCLRVIMLRRYKTIDLFSGCGGMSLGFQNAGFEILAAYDNWKPAVAVYELNFNHPIFSEDLADEKVQKRIKAFKPNVIIGGPPCQDFSSAGHRDENLGRAVLTYVQSSENGIIIFVPRDNVALSVSESKQIPENISHKILAYHHHSMKGDIEAKKATLTVLANQLEPQEKALSQIDNSFKSDLFYAFNNLNIRHNNVDPSDKRYYKKVVAKMDVEELEHWYDETYRMCLLAFMRLEQNARKKEFDEVKSKIEAKE